MTVEPVHCSNPGTGEQAKLKSLKKHLFVTKCFAFSLDVWQISTFISLRETMSRKIKCGDVLSPCVCRKLSRREECIYDGLHE